MQEFCGLGNFCIIPLSKVNEMNEKKKYFLNDAGKLERIFSKTSRARVSSFEVWKKVKNV